MDPTGAAKGGQLGSPQTQLCRQTPGIWIPVRNTNNRIRKQQQLKKKKKWNCKGFLRSKKTPTSFSQEIKNTTKKADGRT